MIDSELGLSIAFNGAIYNYRELRQELEQRGQRFFSHGDTEVILKAYAVWGERCVERLSGMFAFAIWERDSGRVVETGPAEVTELWTFRRIDGGRWLLSAIQQA